ncbi:Hsp20/alpha crystallin family protein [Deltaproteobacteria bacterium TL4]
MMKSLSICPTHRYYPVHSLFENIFGDLSSDNFSLNSYRMSVDVQDAEDAIHLYADVPGVKKEDIKISIEDGVLSIKGERNVEKKEFNSTERVHGTFQRQFRLPNEVNEEEIQAELKDGVLKVTIPKAEKSKPRKITIN